MTTAPNTTTATRAPWRAWLIVAAMWATFAPAWAASASAAYPLSGYEPAPEVARACAGAKTASGVFCEKYGENALRADAQPSGLHQENEAA